MQKKVAYGGLASALCIILLAMSSYLPTLKAATLFMASVISYVVYRITDGKTAFLAYASSAILGFFLCQSGSPVIVVAYCVCFGNYPIFAALLLNRNITMQLIVKAILYIVYFFAVFFIFTKVLIIPLPYSSYLLFGAGAVAFAAYDFLVLRTGEYLLNYLRKGN